MAVAVFVSIWQRRGGDTWLCKVVRALSESCPKGPAELRSPNLEVEVRGDNLEEANQSIPEEVDENSIGEEGGNRDGGL